MVRRGQMLRVPWRYVVYTGLATGPVDDHVLPRQPAASGLAHLGSRPRTRPTRAYQGYPDGLVCQELVPLSPVGELEPEYGETSSPKQWVGPQERRMVQVAEAAEGGLVRWPTRMIENRSLMILLFAFVRRDP